MTPDWSAPWLVMATIALAILLAAALAYRKRQRSYRDFITRHGSRVMRVDGPPVTDEMQRLFGAYAGDEVQGIVQLQRGLLVQYAGGVQLWFIPVVDGEEPGGQAGG